MIIAVGSGFRDYGSDWHHVDGGREFPHLKSHDVWLMNFSDVDVIYSCHLLNYFSFSDAQKLLTCWYVALRKGGTLRLAVPNFRKLVHVYQDFDHYSLDDIRGPLMGEWEMNGEKIFHKSVWDYRKLFEVLKSIGFAEIKEYDWRKTEHAHIDDHSQSFLPKMDKDNGMLISLNIEATK